MDNAEKLQDVSEETKNETPDEVQNQAELSNQDQPEAEEKRKEEVTEEAEEVSAEAAQEESVTDEKKVEPADIKPEDEEVDQPKEEKAEEEKPSDEVKASSDEEEDHHSDEHEEEEEHEEELDFDHATKEEVIAKIREVKNEENIRSLDRVLKAIKPRFDELYEISKNEALQKFVSEGNEAEAFEYHGDEIDKEFFALYGQLRSKRNKHYKDLENQKESNDKSTHKTGA